MSKNSSRHSYSYTSPHTPIHLPTPPLPLPPSPFLITTLKIRKRHIERFSPLDLPLPTPPHILTTLLPQRLRILRALPLPIMFPYRSRLLQIRIAPRAHA